MSHEIHESSFAYAGAKPWHGIGNPLPRNATAEEIVEAAQFFKVTTARSTFQAMSHRLRAFVLSFGPTMGGS